MPQVRRFNVLEVEGTVASIPVLGHIEIEPRLLRADRDFAPRIAGEPGGPLSGQVASANTDSERRPAA